MRNILKLLFVFCFISCKPPARVSKTAYVIDSNDIETITEKDAERIHQDILNSSVVFVTSVSKNSRKYCSGTIIAPQESDGPYRILTNRHCFVEEEGTKEVQPLLSGHCSSTKVFFGYLKGKAHKKSIGYCAGGFRSDPNGDLAIFNLKEVPKSPYNSAELWDGPSPGANKEAMIVHYPFIAKDDARYQTETGYVREAGIRIPFAQVTEDNCLTGEPFSQEEWQFDRALPVSIKHSCDQKKGSSGSGLFDRESGRLIGVNWGGIILSYQNRQKRVHNVATSIGYVRNFVNDIANTGVNISSASGNSDVSVESTKAAESSKKQKQLCGTISNVGSSFWGLVLLMSPLSLGMIGSVMRRWTN